MDKLKVRATINAGNLSQGQQEFLAEAADTHHQLLQIKAAVAQVDWSAALKTIDWKAIFNLILPALIGGLPTILSLVIPALGPIVGPIISAILALLNIKPGPVPTPTPTPTPVNPQDIIVPTPFP